MVHQYRTDWRNVMRCNIVSQQMSSPKQTDTLLYIYCMRSVYNSNIYIILYTVLPLQDTSSSKHWPLSPSVTVYLQTFFWWRFRRPVSWQTDSGVKMQSPFSTSTSITSSVSRKDRMCTVYTVHEPVICVCSKACSKTLSTETSFSEPTVSFPETPN